MSRRVSRTALASATLVSEREAFHLLQLAESLQRLDLDLAHALACQAEAAADLLERLRLGVDEPVAEDDHLPLAPRQRAERLLQRLAAQRDLDLLVGEPAVAGDGVAEH